MHFYKYQAHNCSNPGPGINKIHKGFPPLNCVNNIRDVWTDRWTIKQNACSTLRWGLGGGGVLGGIKTIIMEQNIKTTFRRILAEAFLQFRHLKMLTLALTQHWTLLNYIVLMSLMSIKTSIKDVQWKVYSEYIVVICKSTKINRDQSNAENNVIIDSSKNKQSKTKEKKQKQREQCSRFLLAAGDDESVLEGGVEGEDGIVVRPGHHPGQHVTFPHVDVPTHGSCERHIML